ncbi:exodeoxyribonuclease V subunit alpha [Methylotuvimicrobium sp. KM1]|uniref:exodeoxyribonuclease V subunit alpha n=1 Tax=Methylotuvimicrobium sp. KM1 TaxID=3377707 RepID=UPI003850661F
MKEESTFTRLDMAFSRFLSRRSALTGAEQDNFEKLIARLSFEQNQGHSCIRIDAKAREAVLASGLASTTDTAPLIVEDDRLYLQRYWAYEKNLVNRIGAMTRVNVSPVDAEALLDRYFPFAIAEIDWQREAAKTALNRTFCIITGGPGTGKTTTIVKILALLQELAQRPLFIALAAPTGKAAMRLQESIGNSKSALPCSEAVKQSLPESVTTLHRLLGSRPPSPYFRHNAEKPLPFDLVVVDEASMVDLALMSKLVDALKPSARLILLGDKDQLASVESGAVLADLTAALPDHTVELKKAHRFDVTIKNLAEAVNLQHPEAAWSALQAANENIGLLNQDAIAYIAGHRLDYLRAIENSNDIEQIFNVFKRFQVLCANRAGKYSVADINSQVERRLASTGHINPIGTWYHGRPVMITQNDASLQLYNGDIGLCLKDAEQNGKLMVFFQSPDGSIKKCLPARLPHCETVYAMTIHKSQGSEFDEILIALPDKHNPVLTKELLYTAITRARKSVKILSDQKVFNETVLRKIERFGGLAQKLTTTADL